MSADLNMFPLESRLIFHGGKQMRQGKALRGIPEVRFSIRRKAAPLSSALHRFSLSLFLFL